ncbi:MAG TPA: ammonia-forming cytochrome c nitrite reductase subunit c552, partial [Bacteroidota bacterium]|nr:ammonia-forming cytochrome c nitrite reductase subunit c552 [Bacteroidota bacterium]
MARVNLAGRMLGVLLAFLLVRTSAAADDQCLKCHDTIGDNPSTLFKHDVHFRKGISCADCHGGNPATDDQDKAMDKKAGYRGVPKGDEISKMCAQCHSNPDRMKKYGSALPTNQFDNLLASVHGRLSVSG